MTRLQVDGARAALLPEQLRTRGVAIGRAQRTASGAADFVLFTNESLLRLPAPEIIGAFAEALA